MELPVAFEERMKRILGNEYDAFFSALSGESAVKGLRVNPLRCSAASLSAAVPFALTPIDYVPGGFIVAEEAGAGKHPYHQAGAYYMQDPGAMATVAAIPSEFWQREGLRILDLCAAPGGKTTQLAALCHGRGGVVLANEYVSARSRILAGNVERMGLDNVCVTNTDSGALVGRYPEAFDLVVVDAPCSGEGMYRKNDLAISEWSLENVAMCAERQTEILKNAAETVAPGGYLLYSTCTYSVEENERQVAALLSARPDFSLVPCDASVAAHTREGISEEGAVGDMRLCRRFYPHVSPGEGQFLALLRRAEAALPRGGSVKDAAVPLGREEKTAAETFLKETLGYVPKGLCRLGGNICLCPARISAGLSLPPAGLVAVGVTVGEYRKGRIQPHHHFFMAYGERLARRLLLDPMDGQVAKYLAGEELTVSDAESGYAAVLVRLHDTAVPLGGGKLTGGRLKNYYPKGLRIR